MTETAREQAERLAGPHADDCHDLAVCLPWCAFTKQVQAIEDALREARRQGRESMRKEAWLAIPPGPLADKIRALSLDGPGEEGR